MMRKYMIAALAALSLSACATTATPGPGGVPQGPVDPGAASEPRAPLARTVVDEQALTAAYASFDVLLTAIDGLRVAGVLVPGTPRAVRVAALIRDAQDGLNAARDVRRGLSTRDPAQALDAATGAFRGITAILKGE